MLVFFCSVCHFPFMSCLFLKPETADVYKNQIIQCVVGIRNSNHVVCFPVRTGGVRMQILLKLSQVEKFACMLWSRGWKKMRGYCKHHENNVLSFHTKKIYGLFPPPKTNCRTQKQDRNFFMPHGWRKPPETCLGILIRCYGHRSLKSI